MIDQAITDVYCQEPITWSLHLPYKPLESTLSDETLLIEIVFAENLSCSFTYAFSCSEDTFDNNGGKRDNDV